MQAIACDAGRQDRIRKQLVGIPTLYRTAHANTWPTIEILVARISRPPQLLLSYNKQGAMAGPGVSNGGEPAGTSAANTGTSSGAFQAMSKKMQSFAPGGECSLPSPITSLTVFSRPRQRQKWGDKQILPHTNWGDL